MNGKTTARVGLEKFREWAQANLRPGDAAIIETTTNVWDIYDIVNETVEKTKFGR